MKKHNILIFILLYATCYMVSAQKFIYNIDFTSYFDNREYHEPLQTPQTIFALRLSPEIGLQITDKANGIHRIIAGAHYTQPFGSNFREARLQPTAFYQYRWHGYALLLGIAPTKHRIEPLPDFLNYDSINYAEPNLRGALLQYCSKHGCAEFMCDWRGMQTPMRREMFRLVLNGHYRYTGLFTYFIGGIAQINHKANYAKPTPREGVCDDIYISPNIGVDFAPALPLDSLSLRASYIIAYQTERINEDRRIPQGLLLDFFARWRFLGLKNTLYVGQNLMPFYATYGPDLNQGDPFYQSPCYNRTDLFIYLVRRSFVNCYFSWNLHAVQGQTLQHQQQLIVHFSLDGLHRKQLLRGLFDK